MNLKTLLGTIILSLVLSEVILAQESNLKLSDYQYPNLKRRTLDTEIDFNNRYLKKYDSEDYTEFSLRRFTLDNKTKYSYSHNTSSRQQQLDIFFNQKLDFLNNKWEYSEGNFEESINKDRLYNADFNLYLVNRFFLNAKTFYELNFTSNINIYDNLWIYGGSEDENFIRKVNTYIYIPLKIGKGRIEQIQDVSHAAFILKALSEVGVSSNFGENHVQEFATLLTGLKNKRLLNHRKNELDELEIIDSFLESKDISKNDTMKYYYILKDMWSYGNLPVRKNGLGYALFVTPGYNYQEEYQAGRYDGPPYTLKANYLLLNFGAEVTYEHPINLNWQNIIEAKIRGSILNGKKEYFTFDGDNYSQITQPNISLHFAQKYAYYPNLRAYFELGYSADYIKFIPSSELDEKNRLDFNEEGVQARIFANFNYFLSPELKLSVISVADYQWMDSENYIPIDFNHPVNTVTSISNSSYTYGSKGGNLSCSIKLTYSFF
ncbi:hypothetical protein [Sediminitomix flava]|uniref:Uncharacterized protein n=1 Tax=Sediminitomix flava TaxID=379075 RepID=A0A315ZFS8_SEDFL|nr:hypothetical protein [Sediminitomix flava]PWJ44013.1 hypothetical protein BC781_101363 [Sediminitomix flava]